MIKRILSVLAVACVFLTTAGAANAAGKPWENGRLKVSKDNRYLQFENGDPFFWLANTLWLLPQRADRDEVKFALEECRKHEYNVVQIQVLNDVPSTNIYGQMSNTDGWNFASASQKGVYGYWDHMDYIVHEAERQGIYVAMVCIWSTPVKQGKISKEDAVSYGTFLANRYKDCPNIIWVIGGDIEGNRKTDIWNTLATTIKSIDKNHLMTFHPRGRRTSSEWFSTAPWIDFHMFQSGHRRYGQNFSEETSPIPPGTEEDNWQYVEKTWAQNPMKPVLDAEPAYEDIPQGLHNPAEPHWTDSDVRRYAYWSVFAGSCGHTYGHNAMMQFLKPGYPSSYGDAGDVKSWYQAMKDPGFAQMKHLKNLMMKFPYYDRVPDQSVLTGTMGKKYNRLVATRGKDYLLVYNFTGRRMDIDFRKISGNTKKIFWMDAASGNLIYLGEAANKIQPVNIRHETPGIHDGVLIAFDAEKTYLLTGTVHDWLNK